MTRPVMLWDLKKFHINDDYYVSNVAVYRNRAFLALPRDVCLNNVSSPTAIEVPWTDDVNSPIYNLRKTAFTGENQIWGNCGQLQNVVALNVETKRARLWVLDKGNQICSAKLVLYNLYLNSIIESFLLNDVPSQKFNSLVIDSRRIGTEYEVKALIGDVNGGLLVFSLNERKFWTIELKNPLNPVKKVSAKFLALSKIDSKLFITGDNSLELFSLNADELKMGRQEVNVTYLGDKLEYSSGLETDPKGGLNYYLTRDYAIVRWTTGKPLKAEYHDILGQSYKMLPFVSQLFTGPQNVLWALVNSASPGNCLSINDNDNKIGELSKDLSRVVKVLKYTKLGV